MFEYLATQRMLDDKLSEKAERVSFWHDNLCPDAKEKAFFSRDELDLALDFSISLEELARRLWAKYSNQPLEWDCPHCGNKNNSRKALGLTCDNCHLTFMTKRIRLFPGLEFKPRFRHWICHDCGYWNSTIFGDRFLNCYRCRHENDLESPSAILFPVLANKAETIPDEHEQKAQKLFTEIIAPHYHKAIEEINRLRDPKRQYASLDQDSYASIRATRPAIKLRIVR